MPYQDNVDAVLADLDAEMPRRSHTLTLSNNMEYARWLHDKEGYYVFNPQHAIKTVRTWIQELIDSDQPLTDRNVRLALDGAGFEEVNFLRSYTGDMRPPVKAGEGPRKAHPGGWADITGNLKAAYTHQVDNGPVHTDAEYEG